MCRTHLFGFIRIPEMRDDLGHGRHVRILSSRPLFKPCYLLLPGIRDFHHLHLFALPMRAVHLKNLRIGVRELPDGPMLHDAFKWIGVTPFERNGLVVGTGLPFHGKKC